MTREQSNFLKSKVDGFCMSQLQGEVAAYITNTNREWFAKWPEVAEHFKDDTGHALTENELTDEQMKQLGVYTKQRHAVRVSHLKFHFSLTSIFKIANTFIFVPCILCVRKVTRDSVHENHH